MRKSIQALMLACAFVSVVGTAAAMDSRTLYTDTDKYQIVFADRHKVVFVDSKDLTGGQTRDFPSSHEWFNVKLYVETFKSRQDMDEMSWTTNDTTKRIDEYSGLLSYERGNKISLQNLSLLNAYKPTGEKNALTACDKPVKLDATAIYINLKNQLFNRNNQETDSLHK